MTAAAAFVTVPATDDTALLAVEARLFVTVPTVAAVLFTVLPTAPVTLVTLATPEVSVVAVGVVGVPLLEVFPPVVTEPVAVVAPAGARWRNR